MRESLLCEMAVSTHETCLEHTRRMLVIKFRIIILIALEKIDLPVGSVWHSVLPPPQAPAGNWHLDVMFRVSTLSTFSSFLDKQSGLQKQIAYKLVHHANPEQYWHTCQAAAGICGSVTQ